jgi:hypothetical protein
MFKKNLKNSSVGIQNLRKERMHRVRQPAGARDYKFAVASKNTSWSHPASWSSMTGNKPPTSLAVKMVLMLTTPTTSLQRGS